VRLPPVKARVSPEAAVQAERPTLPSTGRAVRAVGSVAVLSSSRKRPRCRVERLGVTGFSGAIFLASLGVAGCSAAADGVVVGVDQGRDGGVIGADPVDVPIDALSGDGLVTFRSGDAFFDQVMRDADGLGPLYIRNSCGSCHARGGRGPGIVQKMVIVQADGITPSPDQSALPYGPTVRPYVTSGAVQPISAPDRPDDKVTFRAAVPVLGRGYMEAVLDSEIERVEREQQTRVDGIHGCVHRVAYHSQANDASPFNRHRFGDQGLIGRFGLKARIATLDEFAADALQGDMGITSPLRPEELPNPDHLEDDAKAGPDLGIDRVNALGDYVRLLAIPRRIGYSLRGQELFESTACAACHMPTLRTAPDYPVPELAGIDAPVFTDFLLHDMGPDMADGQTDEGAASAAWRTAPLIGLRFMKTYLHDGRAQTLVEAVLAHDSPGSEATVAVALYRALDDVDRAALLTYVGGL
jgi:CxxC motif-containing protein (DUF1111 family)